MNKIYIIILNYKTWEDTIECLESVLKSDYAHYQILVIDNASPNHSLKNIQLWLDGKLNYPINSHKKFHNSVFPLEAKPIDYINTDEKNLKKYANSLVKIILVQATDNNGFSSGNNIGIKYALSQNDFEFIWLLNNDTIVKPDSLSSLINCYRHLAINKKIGILGSKLLFYYQPNTLQAIGGYFNKYTASFSEIGKNKIDAQFVFKQNKISYAIGASMLVTKSFLHDVGLLNENYFLYYEEIDWSLRGIKKNYVTKSCEKSIVYHKEGGTTSTSKNLEIEYYKYYNLLKFYNNFYRKLMPIAYFRLIIKATKKLLRNNLAEAKLIFKVIWTYDYK